MPAKSKNQRQAAGVAYSKKCKQGKTPKSGTAKEMAESMSCKQLKDYATKNKKSKK